MPVEGGRRAVTRVEADGESLAVLIHDAAVLDDPRLVAGVATATRLAVANGRMRAAVRVRVEELAVSRRRLVEAGDIQSRRLQVKLEQGAERRLGRVNELLAALQLTAETAVSEQLSEVRTELSGARVELREFAQGIRPTALSGGGLPAAVPLLAARTAVPVALNVDVGRLPPPVEAAVFFVCSEALANVDKHAEATHASVDIRIHAGDVVADVVDDGVGGADTAGSGLRGLTDRVEALGGTLVVAEAASGGTRLTARIRAALAPFEESR